MTMQRRLLMALAGLTVTVALTTGNDGATAAEGPGEVAPQEVSPTSNPSTAPGEVAPEPEGVSPIPAEAAPAAETLQPARGTGSADGQNVTVVEAKDVSAGTSVDSVAMAPTSGDTLLDSVALMLIARRFDFGADAGLDMALGALAREMQPGFFIRARGAADLDGEWARLELTAAFSRLGRAVEGDATSLMRLPVIASAVITPPLAQFVGPGANAWPAPYLRIGAGPAIAMASGSNGAGRSGFDFVAQWGVGARYALGWAKTAIRLDLTHAVEIESKTAQFFTVTLGFDWEPGFGMATAAPQVAAD